MCDIRSCVCNIPPSLCEDALVIVAVEQSVFCLLSRGILSS